MPRKKKEVERILSEYEMLKLDKLNIESKAARYELEIVKLQKELAIKQFNERITEKADGVKRSDESRGKFNDELKQKFSINEDQWGYDPLTGEINV